MADMVQMEISALQGMNLSPALSWVQAHSLFVLNILHALMHKTAQRLQTAGVAVTVETGGKTQTIENFNGSVKFAASFKKVQSIYMNLWAMTLNFIAFLELY